MKNNVRVNDLAYITRPAFEGAVGHFVHVLRAASGDEDADGVVFDQDAADAGRVIWVVRGHQVPWGEGCVNVFAISDACLRPVRDPKEGVLDVLLLIADTA